MWVFAYMPLTVLGALFIYLFLLVGLPFPNQGREFPGFAGSCLLLASWPTGGNSTSKKTPEIVPEMNMAMASSYDMPLLPRSVT